MLSGINGVNASSYGYDLGISNMQSTLDKLMGLLQNMVDADAKISKNLQDQLQKADKEIAELQKMIDQKKKLPELKEQIEQVTAALDKLMDRLEKAGHKRKS